MVGKKTLIYYDMDDYRRRLIDERKKMEALLKAGKPTVRTLFHLGVSRGMRMAMMIKVMLCSVLVVVVVMRIAKVVVGLLVVVVLVSDGDDDNGDALLSVGGRCGDEDSEGCGGAVGGGGIGERWR